MRDTTVIATLRYPEGNVYMHGKLHYGHHVDDTTCRNTTKVQRSLRYAAWRVHKMTGSDCLTAAVENLFDTAAVTTVRSSDRKRNRTPCLLLSLHTGCAGRKFRCRVRHCRPHSTRCQCLFTTVRKLVRSVYLASSFHDNNMAKMKNSIQFGLSVSVN